MKNAVLGLVSVLLLASPAQAEHLAPRNACSHLNGADRFIATLTTAVANRDADMLRPLVDPQIKLSFGGDYGWESMRTALDSDEDYSDNLWEELDTVIRLGCGSSSPDYLSMPYYWDQEMPEGFDPFATRIVLGEAVPMYRDVEGGAVRRRLRWEAVEDLSFLEPDIRDDGAARLPVRTSDGAHGFVERDKLRSLIAHRLIAERDENGNWRIVTFVAGD